MSRADDSFQKIDASAALEIALRNTRHETLEDLSAAMENEVLSWMRKRFPNDGVTLESLRNSDGMKTNHAISEFHNAMSQDERCILCREKGAYMRCGGKYWEPIPITSHKPKIFCVWFRECGYYRTAKEDADRKKQGSGAAPAPKGFSLSPQTERRDIDA